jgi:mRNA interferase MazF
MALIKVKRGQIWQADFTPQTHREEPGKRARPCLVIQIDILNDAAHATTVVIPATTKVYRDAAGDGYPLRVPIGKLQKPGTASEETDLLIDQMRTISNARLIGDAPLATLNRIQMKRVEEALKLILGLN